MARVAPVSLPMRPNRQIDRHRNGLELDLPMSHHFRVTIGEVFGRVAQPTGPVYGSNSGSRLAWVVSQVRLQLDHRRSGFEYRAQNSGADSAAHPDGVGIFPDAGIGRSPGQGSKLMLGTA